MTPTQAIPRVIVFLDIDGCILRTDGEIPNGFYKAMEDLKTICETKGILVVFCTGRDRNYVECLSFALPVEWAILEGGVALFNTRNKQLVYHPQLPTPMYRRFERIRQQCIEPLIQEYSKNLFLYPGNSVNVTLERVHGETRPIEWFAEKFRAALEDLIDQQLLVLRYSSLAIDISPVGTDGTPIHKGAGISFALEHIFGGQTAERFLRNGTTIYIGDSNGDIPGALMVGGAGGPDNASDEYKSVVREKGGCISRHTFTTGTVDAINQCLRKLGGQPENKFIVPIQTIRRFFGARARV